MNRDDIIARLKDAQADLNRLGVRHVALFGSRARGACYSEPFTSVWRTHTMAAQRRLDLVLDSVKRLLRVGASANLLNLLQKQHPAELGQIFSELLDKAQDPDEIAGIIAGNIR